MGIPRRKKSRIDERIVDEQRQTQSGHVRKPLQPEDFQAGRGIHLVHANKSSVGDLYVGEAEDPECQPGRLRHGLLDLLRTEAAKGSSGILWVGRPTVPLVSDLRQKLPCTDQEICSCALRTSRNI